jgi:predicted PurR-regulated permease PerM
LAPFVDQHAPEPHPAGHDGIVNVAAASVAVVVSVTGIYFGRGFLLPVVLAALGRLVLGPLVRVLKQRARIPEPVGAALVLLAALSFGVYGVYRLADPALAWFDTGPESIRRVEAKLTALRKPVDQMNKAADRVESLATGTDGQKIPAVVIHSTNFRDRLFSQTSGLVTALGMTLVLLYFLLASGDLFLRKVVRLLPRLTDKKVAVEVARRIESNISRYLLLVSVINAGVGVTVGLAMWGIGLPNPMLWGVMVTVLNFIPYVGPLMSQVVLALVGVMTFDSIGHALVAPGIYLAIDILQANFVTPAVLGHRLELNPVVIFLAIAFWTWLWGVAGALLAVPLLTTLKIFCEAYEPLSSVSELLSE